MKKTVFAIAALAAMVSAPAFAQSNVTLYGVVDTAVRHLDNDGADSTLGVASGGQAPSRFGLKGTEDLGGGLKAGFVLEQGIDVSTGQDESASKGGEAKQFSRKSYVSLSGGFGEVRLGQDHLPTHNAILAYDPFGAAGVANLKAVTTGIEARAGNQIAYTSPTYSGFTANFAITGDDEATGASGYRGLGLNYANGPLTATLALSTKETGVNVDSKNTIMGASYDLGTAKVLASYSQNKVTNQETAKTFSLGAVVPMGSGAVKVSYANLDAGNNAEADLFAVGYEHNLSKRTALYGTYSMIDNKGMSDRGVANSTVSAGGQSTGLEVGVRHNF